mmetsp:Transcript_77119/g.249644  ORF Transcript_77119/g.249644 Transcript_77119/m.249644 type:complete len:306 (+) Transcript_77119:1280-2197(+)
MFARLTAALEARLELALAGRDDEHTDVGLRGTADHVRHIRLVAWRVEHREAAVRGLEGSAANLDGLALGLLLLAGVHDVGEEPTLAVLLLGLLHVLLDLSLVHAAAQEEDVTTSRGLAGIDVTNEHHVQVRPRVRNLEFALFPLRNLPPLLLLLLCLRRRRGGGKLCRLLRRGRRFDDRLGCLRRRGLRCLGRLLLLLLLVVVVAAAPCSGNVVSGSFAGADGLRRLRGRACRKRRRTLPLPAERGAHGARRRPWRDEVGRRLGDGGGGLQGRFLKRACRRKRPLARRRRWPLLRRAGRRRRRCR